MKRSILLVLPLLAACSSLQNFSMPKISMPDIAMPSPYRMDIRQGNFVTQEMVAQLKPGMTKDQVRYALGTPLLMDVFHGERWDYVYRFAEGKGKVEERKLAVFFEQGKLARVSGDVVASAPAGASVQPVAANTSRVVEIKLPEGATMPVDEPSAAPSAASRSWAWLKSLWPF